MWPVIAYRQIGSRLVACHGDKDGLPVAYPKPERLYDLVGEWPSDAMARLKSLPRRSVRKLERLMVFCPEGCTLVAIYELNGWLLLKLRGEMLMRDGGVGPVLTSAERPGRAAYLPHQPRWLMGPPGEFAWSIYCPHGSHTINTFEAYTAACSAYVAKKRRATSAAAFTPSLRRYTGAQT